MSILESCSTHFKASTSWIHPLLHCDLRLSRSPRAFQELRGMVTTPDLSCWGDGCGAVFPINQEERLGIGQLTCAEVHRRPITVYSPVQPQRILLGGRPASSRHASSHANAASRPSGLASRNALKYSIAAARSCSFPAGESGEPSVL
ncbi:MAG: hypothetical protein QOJ51_5181 [Acidobacteriaceae bacterium]|nr:hypothetical protein [Acidobacteriaceae bacterium]